MKNAVWAKALKNCAEPHRARHFLDLLAATDAKEALTKMLEPQATVLAALFSGSQALSNLLLAHPDWLSTIEIDALRFPRRKQGLEQEVNRWLAPALASADFGTVLSNLRQFKQ